MEEINIVAPRGWQGPERRSSAYAGRIAVVFDKRKREIPNNVGREGTEASFPDPKAGAEIEANQRK